jgi:hypothetical protein
VGEGDGEGSGVGFGVCAKVAIGSFVATRPAAPNAGRSFTKERRLFEVLRFRCLPSWFSPLLFTIVSSVELTGSSLGP